MVSEAGPEMSKEDLYLRLSSVRFRTERSNIKLYWTGYEIMTSILEKGKRANYVWKIYEKVFSYTAQRVRN